MTNYKYRTTDNIIVAGITKELNPVTDTPMMLYYPHNLGGAPQSLRGISSQDADYSVPAGQTYRVVGIRLHHTATSGIIRFYEGDTLDAVTTIRAIITTPTFAGTTEYYFQNTFLISSEKFLTSDPAAANINGVETIGYLTVD